MPTLHSYGFALKNRIKILNEKAKATTRLTLKKAKHTNISGGSKAHSGGELWFISKDTVLLNGCSGRYGPRSEIKLNEIIDIFKTTGLDLLYRQDGMTK